MTQLPNDPVLLLSVVNTALRDRFPTLERLAAFYQTDPESIKKRLEAINYFYDSETNQFL